MKILILSLFTISITSCVDPCNTIIIDEVYTGLVNTDDVSSEQWINLFNKCDESIDLNGWVIRWGKQGYQGEYKFTGTVGAKKCYLIGGPLFSDNISPTEYDEAESFFPLIPLPETINSPMTGIGLFEPDDGSGDDTPVDGAFFGSNISNLFVDPLGNSGDNIQPNSIAEESMTENESIKRIDEPFRFDNRENPTPGRCELLASDSENLDLEKYNSIHNLK